MIVMRRLFSSIPGKLEYKVVTKRIDSSLGSLSRCKSAVLSIDTTSKGSQDLFNPAELLLASLSACMLKGIERVAPLLNFSYEGVEIVITGVRQDSPPKMERIEYLIVVDTNEPEARLALLHTNIKKYGTVFNTVQPGVASFSGVVMKRASG